MKKNFSLFPNENVYNEKIYGIYLKNNQSNYSVVLEKEDILSKNENNENTRLDSFLSETSKQIIYSPFIKKLSKIYDKLLISYNSKLKNIFDIIVLILVNASSLIILYDVCYKDYESEDYFEINFTETFFYYIIEILFAIYIILQFFQTFQDKNKLIEVRSFKRIAKRYLKFWFYIDFISIIPFELMISKEDFYNYFKLFRLLRLPKFIQTIDVKRFDNLMGNIITQRNKENGNKKLKLLFNIRYIFKIIRLIIMASIITYILGCFWYIYCYYIYLYRIDFNDDEDSFIIKYHLLYVSSHERFIYSCYFVLTALSTVGYGDYNAQNDLEKIFGIIIMLLGVAIFSYVMSEFSDQINIYNQTFGDMNKSENLQNWLYLMNKYDKNRPVDNELIFKIEKDFKFFWKNDRTKSIEKNDRFLVNLPKDTKIKLVDYFWKDIFDKFSFFDTKIDHKENINQKNKYYKFYYELSFLMLPRFFETNEKIYEINQETEEIYFIMEGQVVLNIPELNRNFLKLYSGDYFGGYYCLYNCNSHYDYIAFTDCKMFAINKKSLLILLLNFPDLFEKMRIKEYNKFKNGIKNIMDKKLKSEFGNDYKIFDLVEQNENLFGMNINKIIKKNIDFKENEIKNLMNDVEKKYNDLNDKYKNVKDLYKNFYDKCENDYKIINNSNKNNNNNINSNDINNIL